MDTMEFKMPVYDDVAQAINALNQTKRVIDQRGYVCVSELFKNSNAPVPLGADSYGWSDLSNVEIIHDDFDRFTLKTPPAISLGHPKEVVTQKAEPVKMTETRRDIDAFSQELHELFCSLTEAGFTEKQALTIVIDCIRSERKGNKNEN